MMSEGMKDKLVAVLCLKSGGLLKPRTHSSLCGKCKSGWGKDWQTCQRCGFSKTTDELEPSKKEKPHDKKDNRP